MKVRSDLFVLPEATSSIKFSLDLLPDLASRDFCVLVTLSATLWQLIAHVCGSNVTKTFWTRPDASLNVTDSVDRKSAGLSLFLPAQVNDLVVYREFSAREYRHRETSQPHEYVGVGSLRDQTTVDTVAREIPVFYNGTSLRAVRALLSEITNTAHHSSCSYPWVCVWAVWVGYAASVPISQLVSASLMNRKCSQGRTRRAHGRGDVGITHAPVP